MRARSLRHERVTQGKQLRDKDHPHKGEFLPVVGSNGDRVGMHDGPGEIGFTLFLFDPVDLFPFSEARVVQFLFKRSPPEK